MLQNGLNIQLRTASKPGQDHCGDQCRYWNRGRTVTFAVADGLGHGHKAESTANEAVKYVGTMLGQPIDEIFKSTDRALRLTRGLALGIGVIDFENETLSYGCIGNIHAVLMSSKTTIFPATPGIVGCGAQLRKVEHSALEEGDLLIVNTDGIKSLTSSKHLSDDIFHLTDRIADEIIEKWRKNDDDSGLLVYRHRECDGQ